jgi:anti-sigma regulatory factor (Ser/Thr protein kinase)
MDFQHAHVGPVVLFMRMHPSWMFVDDIRRFVESFCAAACPGADREEQLALAAHELVQNAIAHASTPGVELRLEVDRDAKRVRVSVSNAARAEQVQTLRDRIDEARAQGDALQAYLAALHRDPEARGGIGLSRVRFESSLDLDLAVDGDRVTVHASGPLAAPPHAWHPGLGAGPASVKLAQL